MKVTDEDHFASKMAIVYNQCVAQVDEEDYIQETIVDVLSQSGGWPVIDTNWTGDDYVISHALAIMKYLGYKHDLFAEIDIEVDLTNNTVNFIQVS